MFSKCPTGMTLQHKVANVLFHYRNGPHTTTGRTPVELFLKRGPRTRLSLVKPSLKNKVEKGQVTAKAQRDGRFPKHRSFDLYQPVRVRHLRGGKERWIPGTIVEVKGPHTYLVRVPGNNRRFVHADHLIPGDSRTQSETPSECPPLDLQESGGVADRDLPLPVPALTSQPDMVPNVLSGGELRPRTPTSVSESPSPGGNTQEPGSIPYKTRSGRISKAPDWYGDYVKK